jgi:hypothetical protein
MFAFCLLSFASESVPPEAPATKAGATKSAGQSQDGSVYFLSDVMPLVTQLGCNVSKCHGSAGGKGGLKFSMFGADPEFDYAALLKSAAGRRVDKVEPLRSLFLLKATASVPHEGAEKVEPDSPQYRLLASWVAQGARWRDAHAPDLVSIKLSPAEQVVQKGETGRLQTTAVFSDGTEKDVTGFAGYSSSDQSVVSVAGAGPVKAEDFGEVFVVARYMRRFATVHLLVPQPLPQSFPKTKANNKIDELVFAKLQKLGIPPSEVCSDQEFLRRVYLDVTGTLPAADEARAFLSDADPQKRSKQIDRLLASEEFADYWALKWGDLLRIKSEFPSNLWPNAVQAYYHWVRDGIVRNKPYDQFARELLTSSGSNFRVPPVNYYRALLKRDPQNLAEVTALVFMGTRIGCAHCHAHPDENWTLDDTLGMAAFFSQVRYKNTLEWKEEIVYLNPQQTLRHPTTGEVLKPKVLGGEAREPAADQDLREVFAQWLTAAENPWFAKNIVNRIWFWLLGRGIVHEPDDLRSTNPPENPELLQYLQDELVAHHYDLKHIYRLILNSATYQLSSTTNQWNRGDTVHFSHYSVKRLGAETLLDAIGQVTQRWDTYRSIIPEPFVEMPDGFRATHLADGSVGLPFLELFGRPARDTAFESQRDLELSARQTLHLLNSGDVQTKITGSPRLQRLLKEKQDPEIVEEIYLSALGRLPSDEEKQNLLKYLSRDPKQRTQSVQDLVWAVLNTKEFLFNH